MRAALPIFTTDDKDITLLQTNWSAVLNPLLSNPTNIGMLLKNVSLDVGDNAINHRLGRKLQGWIIVRQRSAASIYDKQDDNKFPALTLTLNASAPVEVDLYVF